MFEWTIARRPVVKQQGDRRNVFLRYLGEVAGAVSEINQTDKKKLYDDLLRIATKVTAEADIKLDNRGRPIVEPVADLGDNVLIVDPTDTDHGIIRPVKLTEDL